MLEQGTYVCVCVKSQPMTAFDSVIKSPYIRTHVKGQSVMDNYYIKCLVLQAMCRVSANNFVQHTCSAGNLMIACHEMSLHWSMKKGANYESFYFFRKLFSPRNSFVMKSKLDSSFQLKTLGDL